MASDVDSASNGGVATERYVDPASGVGAWSRRERALIAGAVVLGGALRVWQYAGGTSLWLDEANLAVGIMRAGLYDVLARPLPFNQVAPQGFLLLQKLIISAMGPIDYALRIVPFVSSLIALVAFARLATRVLDGAGPAIAVLMFATSAPLISFSAVAKQYSSDVCVAVLLWCLAWELMSRPLSLRRAVWAAAAGAIASWLSQPSVLMLAAFGALFVAWPLWSCSNLGSWRNLAVVLAGWGLSAAAVTLVGLASMTPFMREFMLYNWVGGFPPVRISRVYDVLWPADRILALLGRGGEFTSLAFPVPVLYGALLAGGSFLLWHRHRRAALLLAGPAVVALCAAITRQYPFSDRLILFLVPAVILSIAGAIEGLRRFVQPVSPALAAAIALALVGGAVYPVAAMPPVYREEDIKRILTHLQAARRDGDEIYVYRFAVPAVTFYGSRYDLESGDYIAAGCHVGNERRYLEELDAFRGRSRVWVLMTHGLMRPFEREDMLAYLDTIGRRTDSLIVPSRTVGRRSSPAELYRYDLSDMEKAASASAATFRVRVSTLPVADLRFIC